MLPYIILILLPILVHFIISCDKSIDIFNKDQNHKIMKLFWTLLLILLVNRHEIVGRDLRVYKHIFNTISKSNWRNALVRSAEVGNNFLYKIVSVCTDNFQWIIAITAVLSVYFMYKSYIRYTEDASLTIAIFINLSNFVLLFSGLRQSIAISFGFVAFEYVKKKKKFSFLFVVVLAMLFHTSAFILLAMYPLYHVKITKKELIVVVPLLGVFFAFNKPIFSMLTSLLSKFTKYDGQISSTGAYTMLILFILFAIFSFVIPDEAKLDNDTIGMRNFLLFSVALQMFAPLYSIAMRMNYYYIIFIPLLIPKIIIYRSITWNRIAMDARRIIVIIFILYFFWTAPRDNVLDIFPYKFFWEKI